jgi:hypothetical protein
MSTTNGNFTKINRVKVLDELVVSKATIGENRRRVINHVFPGGISTLTLSSKLHDNSIILLDADVAGDTIVRLPTVTSDMAGFSCDLVKINLAGATIEVSTVETGLVRGKIILTNSFITILQADKGIKFHNTSKYGDSVHIQCNGIGYELECVGSGIDHFVTV